MQFSFEINEFGIITDLSKDSIINIEWSHRTYVPGVRLPDDGVAVDAAPVLIAAARLTGQGRRRRRDPVALRGRRGHDSVLFESPGEHRLKIE